jgi:hypothetical protein
VASAEQNVILILILINVYSTEGNNMAIKKTHCHECGTEIEDGEYYCRSCKRKAGDLDGTPEIEEAAE